jgi:phosphoribosyl 1,2-cyclic phosphate phosphodiesterase
MRITVLGSGTSTGIPVVGCDCPVCASPLPENKRLRCGVYVEAGEDKFLIDCSSDFRQQALRHRMPRIDAVVMTHDHADHLNGIDDLRLYNFMQRKPIDIFARHDVLDTIRRRYEYCFNPKQIGGGVPQLNLVEIKDGVPFRVGQTTLVPVPVKHGVIDILGYRVGRGFGYVTDCSAAPDSSVCLLEGVDTLIVGALRREPHPTHFTLDDALAFSRRVGARRTWFTHIACRMEHFETNASLPLDAQLLFDGQILEVSED